MPGQPPSRFLWPLLLGTGIFLGQAIPMSKLAARHGVCAMDFALWPALAAALFLMVRAFRRHGPPRRPLSLALFGLCAGVLGYAVPMCLAFHLSKHASAGFAALAFTLPPVFTLGMSLALGLEAWRRERGLAVLVGLAGALLLVWARIRDGGLDTASPLAAMLLLVIPLSIGAGNIYRIRCLPAKVPNEWLGAATLLGAVLLLFTLRLLTGPGLPAPSPRALGAMALQTLTMSLGYVLYFRFQRVAEPVSFSFLGYVITLTGILGGVLLLDEALPLHALLSLALVLLGFWLIRRSAPAQGSW